MKLILTDLVKDIQDVHISKYGYFYFFKNCVIVEIHEGVTFNWKAGQELIEKIILQYGVNASVNIISNRVNNYSITRPDWIKFFNSKYSKILKSYSIVTYKNSSLSNIMCEKLFIKIKVDHFDNLNQAITWLEIKNSLESA